MEPNEFELRLTPSSETLSDAEAQLVQPFFTNATRSIVALRHLPEVVKGALFSRYSRSAKGVRRLFLDEFLPRRELGISEPTRDEIAPAAARAEAFYRRILSEYGDDSVGELGGAHLACQDISQLAAKAIEHGRLGISYLEKSSRYVPFDDKVNGQYRYYRPRAILESPLGAEYIATLDALFDAYARHLPRLIEHLTQRYPIASLEFEDASRGAVWRYDEIRDEDFLARAHAAYRQALRARACDMLRGFLPLATLTNVGVWGNGRALEYMLVRLYADPLDEAQTIACAAQYELEQVIGPFVKRANDDKGKAFQAFLREMHARERALANEFLVGTRDEGRRTKVDEKVTLIHYDADALERVVAAILYPASGLPKTEILNRVRELGDDEKTRIIRAYVGERTNRRHKPGRAFEHATYEFDLLINIGEYRDLQRHRVLTPERQMFTTAHGYTMNDEIAGVPEIRAEYARCMERAAALYERLARALPFEAQYVVPFGFRVRYNLRLNLREAYHLIELRSAPQGHPDYRAAALYERLARALPFEAQYVVPFGFRVRYNLRLNLREAYHLIELRSAPQGHPDYRATAQAMYRALRAAHPALVAPMQFVDLTPDVPLGRLRAEMRKEKTLETG